MKPQGASRALYWLAAVATVLSLSACAMHRMIDSEVESFVGPSGAVRGASYRFERLPSQQAQPAAQEHIETLAQAALGRAGLVRNGAHPRYSVQVALKVVQYQPAPRYQSHFGSPFIAADGFPFYPAPLLVLEPPWYSHTVHLLMRDTATGQVAYESTARFDGPWSDSANLLPAILEAALRDYPNPPLGVRKVVIDLPPPGKAARE